MEYAYTYEQFMEHLQDLQPVIQEDRSPSFIHATVACINHMTERYPEKEARDKATRFMFAIHHLVANIEDFDIGRYAVCGSKEVGALVSKNLLKAVHHWFTSTPFEKLRPPKAEELMKLADTFGEPA